MDDAALIDHAAFTELQDTAGAEFVVDLIETFAEEAPQILESMRSALASDSADAFRRAAHSIKSNAHAFGAGRLAESARALELGGMPAGAAVIDALAAELELSLAALRRLARG